MATQEARSDGAYESVFVARQPIFDRELKVWAYELLFRHSATAQSAVIADADQATLQVIADGLAIAEPSMDPDKRIMINFPRSLLLQERAFALPPERCVVEILESVEPEDAVVAACQKLKRSGYQLALDDFVGQPGYERLLDLADIVKVDVLHLEPREVERVVRRLGKFPCRLLAEKVEDRAGFQRVSLLGFTLFQGFFFSKPLTIEGRKTSANQVSKLRLIAELGQTEFNLTSLSKILQADASLSHRLFRYVNSVTVGLRSPVKSMRHALGLLGEVQTREWLRVILLTDLTNRPETEELLFISAQRGRFLELVTAAMEPPPLPPDSMFLLGLFSLLDAALGQPMAELMEKLPIDHRIKGALCDPGDALKVWIELLGAFEHAEWDEVESLMVRVGLDPHNAARLYVQAMEWAQEVLKARAAV